MKKTTMKKNERIISIKIPLEIVNYCKENMVEIDQLTDHIFQILDYMDAFSKHRSVDHGIYKSQLFYRIRERKVDGVPVEKFYAAYSFIWRVLEYINIINYDENQIIARYDERYVRYEIIHFLLENHEDKFIKKFCNKLAKSNKFPDLKTIYEMIKCH